MTRPLKKPPAQSEMAPKEPAPMGSGYRTSLLTPEQWDELELSIKEADEGKFATEEEVAALWKKAGLSP